MSNQTLSKDILLAEDDLDDVHIFDIALKELDFSYVLRHAENGEMLFVLLKDKIPYILFLDINMPCKDGFACILEIRKNKDYDKLPVVMYTSNLYDKIVDECYRSGANLYLTKTTTFSELTDKLRKIFFIDWNDYLHYPPRGQFVFS